ncbi:hypothetical protein [Amycolatopsis sp. NPDC004079]|uniref:hypothetical protein n=1 Tax=Amycolatopsis sp. NPDC004079 TaxID=3154549 RepID=UPI0033A258FB
MPNGIWAGFDPYDQQAHIDEIAAERRDVEQEAQDEIAAEQAAEQAAGLAFRS